MLLMLVKKQKVVTAAAVISLIGSARKTANTLSSKNNGNAKISGIKSTTAAENCGFNDYAGFYRAFVAENGITPTEFVKMNR